jgi:HEAT repeat protein
MAEATPVPPQTGDADPEVRYRTVRGLSPDDAGQLAQLLAHLADESWRVRRMAVERLASTAEPARVIPELLVALADGENAGRRNAAAEALVALGRAAVDALCETLTSADSDVRKLAADALGEIGDVRAVAALSPAVADADRNVRAAAAEALGKIGGADAAAALEGALRQDDQTLRLATLDALGRAGHTPPISLLAPLAQDPFLRRPLYRLLGSLSDPVALELILSGLREHARGTREAALAALANQRALRRGGGYASLARRVRDLAHASPEIAAGARAALGSEDPLVVQGALWVLAMIQDTSAASAVAAAGADDRHRDTAVAALEAMGAAAGVALVSSLPSLSPGGRATAIRALARLREWSAVSPLSTLAASGDPDERVMALEALGELGDPSAVPLLATLLGEEMVAAAAARAMTTIGRRDASAVRDEVHRRMAKGPTPLLVRLLGEIGGPEDMVALRQAAGSPDAPIRVAAIEAMAALRLAAGGELVAHRLADEDAAVRAAAARALAVFDMPETRRALRAALTDDDPQVASAAATSLGSMGAREAVPDLLALFDLRGGEEGGPGVLPVLAAVRAVTRLGGLDAAALARALAHADSEVVKEALAAAPSVPGAATAILRVAEHARWDVRAAAARALGATGDRAVIEALQKLAAKENDRIAAAAFAQAIQSLAARPG